MDAIKKVPIPAAGVSLGLVALGNLVADCSSVAQAACVGLSLFMAALLLARVIMFPKSIAEDLGNPILASVSATLFMALMQVAAYFAPAAFLPAFALWSLSVAGHLSLMGWFAMRHLRAFALERVFPSYFICYVGIIVAAVTSPAFGMEALGSVLFWVGFALYPVLLVLVTARYAKHPVPEAARPLFCIYSAPASLSIVGYLAVTEQPSLALVAVLLIAAQAFFVMVLSQLPKFIAGGFFPSFAAMTFPFVITATALGYALELFQAAGVEGLGILQAIQAFETAFAAAMVLFVFVRYLVFLFKPVRAAEPEALGEALAEG